MVSQNFLSNVWAFITKGVPNEMLDAQSRKVYADALKRLSFFLHNNLNFSYEYELAINACILTLRNWRLFDFTGEPHYLSLSREKEILSVISALELDDEEKEALQTVKLANGLSYNLAGIGNTYEDAILVSLPRIKVLRRILCEVEGPDYRVQEVEYEFDESIETLEAFLKRKRKEYGWREYRIYYCYDLDNSK